MENHGKEEVSSEFPEDISKESNPVWVTMDDLWLNINKGQSDILENHQTKEVFEKFDYVDTNVEYIGEVQEEIQDVIFQLNRRSHDKGLLLHGPSGSGKTFLAKHIAKETGRKLFYRSSSSFINSYQGSGPATIKNLFEMAEKCSELCIIFIDEVDGIAKSKIGDNHTEKNLSLNALLTCLNSIEGSKRIFFIAATNVKDELDLSFINRLNIIEIPAPSMKNREIFVCHYLNKLTHSLSDSEIKKIIKELENLSIRDIQEVYDKSDLFCIKNSKEITYADLSSIIKKEKKQLPKKKNLGLALIIGRKMYKSRLEKIFCI